MSNKVVMYVFNIALKNKNNFDTKINTINKEANSIVNCSLVYFFTIVKLEINSCSKINSG